MWHLFESQIFLEGLSRPKAIANAMKLEQWLLALYRDRNAVKFPTTEFMNRGPSAVRRKAELQSAIDELVGRHRLRRMDSERAVELNPALLRL